MDVGWARPDEAEPVADLLAEAARFMAERTSSRWAWRVEDLGFPRVTAWIERRELIVARESDEVIGSALLTWVDDEFWPDHAHDTAGYLHKLAVRRRWAGRGVAGQLVTFAAQAVRSAGRDTLRLDCHPGIARVYEAMGFIQLDEVCRGPDYVVARFQQAAAVLAAS